MNINERIDWKAGMELTAQTFKDLDANLLHRQQIASRTVNGNQFGIIPFTTFENQGGIVRNKLEIEQLSCMALLPSGKILHIDEKVVVPIPLVYGDIYYLACEFSDKQLQYEIQDVPFIRSEYTYGIYTLDELKGTDRFPVMKFKVNDGNFSIDENYILPCLHLSSDNRFKVFLEKLSEKTAILANHQNLENTEAKRSLQHFSFLLKNYSLKNRTQQFIQLTQEIAQAVDFYIVSPNTESTKELATYSEYDIYLWLEWLDTYLHGAATILDNVILEDHSIDLEELKRQIKAELYAQLYPELKECLYTDLKEQLSTEIKEELTLQLTDYINNHLKDELHNALYEELSEELYDKLYQALFDALYKALYIPIEEKKEEEFMPLI